ncbi:MAG TPA: PhzF family phenazine biosynthesis protein [Bryobacteraceae bacterium]|nr:PhzF family phenazine biosynthesis protein [Bryobacteraceae bacterium]
MKIPIYQVDAFAGCLFGGNPAAVCPLEEWPEDHVMQSIAAENNLAETAFFLRHGEPHALRWFTPALEVDLCGHATLASAFVFFEYLDRAARAVRFSTRSGELLVRREGGLLAMDFPARPPRQCEPDAALAAALGKTPCELWESRDYMAVYNSEDEVRALAPDMKALAAIGHFAVIVTAPGRSSDFVSRFFAPASGVDEDPVTGSAHCTLVPFWARRLGKSELHAMQVSARGGELFCRDRGGRVEIAGRAVPYLEGVINV